MTKINRSTIIDSFIRYDLETLLDEPKMIITSYLSDILLVGIKGYSTFTNLELKKEYFKRFKSKIKVL